MGPLRKLGAIGASLALATTSLVVAAPAGADTFPINAPLDGGLELAKPGEEPMVMEMNDPSTFVGSYDNETGEVDGTITLAGGTIATHVDDPVSIDLDIDYEFIGGDPITDGSLDAEGNLAFHDSKGVRITQITAAGILKADPTPDCVIGPIDMAYSGTYDFDTGEAAVESDGAQIVSNLPEGACGAILGNDVADAVNDLADGATATATLTFEFTAEPPAEDEPITKLNVLTDPPVASQITVDGLIADTWGVHDLDVTPGEHEVCFGDVAGWNTPDCIDVTVAEGTTETVTGAFTHETLLEVGTTPAVNSRITIDGAPANNWGVHGVAVTPGEHEVCFSNVDGWEPFVECSTIDADEGLTTTIVAGFGENSEATAPTGTGALRVETVPAVKSTISIDGVVADTWGLDWLQIEAGTHEVCFGDVDGWITPDCETVDVEAGGTTEIQGEFTEDDTGYLSLDNDPGVDVTIQVSTVSSATPVARGNWGMDISLPAGDYEVCWGDSAEFGPPVAPMGGCSTVTVTAGSTTHVTATYGSGVGTTM